MKPVHTIVGGHRHGDRGDWLFESFVYLSGTDSSRPEFPLSHFKHVCTAFFHSDTQALVSALKVSNGTGPTALIT